MANPFKKVEDFENEINDFLKRNKTFISNQGKRISDYFEMSCYNYIVRFYQNQGVNHVDWVLRFSRVWTGPAGMKRSDWALRVWYSRS